MIIFHSENALVPTVLKVGATCIAYFHMHCSTRIRCSFVFFFFFLFYASIVFRRNFNTQNTATRVNAGRNARFQNAANVFFFFFLPGTVVAIWLMSVKLKMHDAAIGFIGSSFDLIAAVCYSFVTQPWQLYAGPYVTKYYD